MADQARLDCTKPAIARRFHIAVRAAAISSAMLTSATYAQTAQIIEDSSSTTTCAGLTLNRYKTEVVCDNESEDKAAWFRAKAKNVLADDKKYLDEICASKYQNMQYPQRFIEPMQERAARYNGYSDQSRSQLLACAPDETILETMKKKRDEAYGIREFLKSVYNETNRSRFSAILLDIADAAYIAFAGAGDAPLVPSQEVGEIAKDVGQQVVSQAVPTMVKDVPPNDPTVLIRFRNMLRP